MDFRQWILTAVVVTVSFATSILSLMALRKFGFVFSDNSLGEFVFVTYVISTVSTYCAKKFLERYVLDKCFPSQQIYQKRPDSSSRIQVASVFYNLPLDLPDVRDKFSRRRNSYPLQLTEKMNYAFRNLGQTSGANLSFSDGRIEGPRLTESMKKPNRSMHTSLKGRSIGNAHVVLRQCVKQVDDIVEHLKSFTKRNILHEVRSKDNSEHVRGIKSTKGKENEASSQETSSLLTGSDVIPSSQNEKQNEQLSCAISEHSNDHKEVQQLSGIGYLSHAESDEAAIDFSHQSIKEANVEPYELGEQQEEHPKSDCSPLRDDNNSTDVSSQRSKEILLDTAMHLPGSEEKLQQPSENYSLSHSAVEKKNAEVSLQRTSTRINSGIILDPVNLGKELKQLGIFYEDASSEYKPDEMFLGTREIEMKDFVSGQDTNKQLDSPYLPCSTDSTSGSDCVKLTSEAIGHDISDTASAEEEITDIAVEQCTESQVGSDTESMPDASEKNSRSVSSDVAFHADLTELQKVKRYLSSTDVDRIYSGSPENASIGASPDLFLNPFELECDLCDFETQDMLGEMDSISLDSVEDDSEGTTNSDPCSVGQEKQKQEIKESLLSRIINIFKIGTNSKDRGKNPGT